MRYLFKKHFRQWFQVLRMRLRMRILTWRGRFHKKVQTKMDKSSVYIDPHQAASSALFIIFMLVFGFAMVITNALPGAMVGAFFIPAIIVALWFFLTSFQFSARGF